MCNVKGFACSDELAKNYYLTPEVPLNSMEYFSIFQLIILV